LNSGGGGRLGYITLITNRFGSGRPPESDGVNGRVSAPPSERDTFDRTDNADDATAGIVPVEAEIPLMVVNIGFSEKHIGQCAVNPRVDRPVIGI
jgi:hypothetical protein